tara:strand:+ start:592 stop:696 length:105 start_codon:yes stop_codon:yes gene_type:complete
MLNDSNLKIAINIIGYGVGFGMIAIYLDATYFNF